MEMKKDRTGRNLNTSEYWNEVYKRENESGDIVKSNYHRNYKNVFKKAVELIPDGSSVLDVACGSGIFCRLLKKKRPACDVTGIDFSDYIIARNKEEDKNSDIKYLQCDIRKKMPFNKKFDVIVMSEIIEHFKQPEKILENVIGSLKKGGLLFANCPHDEDVHYWMERNDVMGEHQAIITHDSLFHMLANYSDEVRYIKLRPLRPEWHDWHIFAYIKKV